MDLVRLATLIAVNAHKEQFRKDGVTPYIIHPWRVASKVGDDPVTQAVAWLHDTIEDTYEDAESLRAQGIPDEVVKLVQLLTKPDDKKDYVKYLERVAAHHVAREVKKADMLDNLADDPSPKQIRKYGKGLLILMGDEECRGGVSP